MRAVPPGGVVAVSPLCFAALYFAAVFRRCFMKAMPTVHEHSLRPPAQGKRQHQRTGRTL
jgi:hypothetical protein